LWIDVGSRDERVHNNGISHFVEHMVFKGTKHFSLQAIARSLESDGGYLNAFTSKEHTCFYARSLDVHLPKAVDVVADLVRHPLFERKEIEKERLVVLEEFKNLEDDPDELIHDYFDDRLFHDHPLRFPVLGKTKNVESFTREMLCEWKREHYVPGKMVIAAAGNLKHETVVALVEKHFGSGSSRHGTVRRPHQPRSHHPCKAVFDRPILQAHLCMGTLGCSVRAHQRYPLMVMNTLLGEGMSSRLFQNLRERHGLAYTVYSFVNTMSDTGNFGVYAATDAKNVDRSIELITKVFDKLRSMPVGPTELRRTKSQLKGMMMLSLESMSSRMMRLGSGELYYGTNIPLDEIIRKIDAVEADEVFEVSKNFLKVEDFTTVIFRPKASELQ
jgi:predicted Zn-dependent peptidase